MAKKHYESVLIINAALEDDQIENVISRQKDMMTSNSIEIIDVDKWGRKRLAYPIQKSKSGYYVVIRYLAPAEVIAKIDRSFRLDETIIRHLTVALESAALEHYEALKNKPAEKNDAPENAVINDEVKETDNN